MTRLDPQEVQQVVRRHFRRLATSSGINLAQVAAQMHEEEAVLFFVSVMRDITAALPARMAAAERILITARGVPKPWLHGGETIDRDAVGATGHTVGAEIEAIERTTMLHQELDLLLRHKVPSENWPDRVREIAAELLPYYSAGYDDSETS